MHSNISSMQTIKILCKVNLNGCYLWLKYFRLSIYQGSKKIVNSGALYNSHITGGRVGVYQFGGFSTIWSFLNVRCLERANKALYLDGNGTYLQLSTVKDYATLITTQDLERDKR